MRLSGFDAAIYIANNICLYEGTYFSEVLSWLAATMLDYVTVGNAA